MRWGRDTGLATDDGFGDDWRSTKRRMAGIWRKNRSIQKWLNGFEMHEEIWAPRGDGFDGWQREGAAERRGN